MLRDARRQALTETMDGIAAEDVENLPVEDIERCTRRESIR
jgi:hypothetical protein